MDNHAGILKDQFSLAGWQAQLANLAVFLAYFFMGIPAGKMLEKIGYKKQEVTITVVNGETTNLNIELEKN